MVIVVNKNTPEEKINNLIKLLESKNMTVNISRGQAYCVLGLIGDTSNIDPHSIEVFDFVEKVIKVHEPFKRVNRLFHPENSIIDIHGKTIGGNKLAIIAGPCSVENENQIISIAESVKKSGATFLRGGAFKPRTSPYSFQGLKQEGLDLLIKAKEATGLPIVTEIMSVDMLDRFVRDVDIIQLGARNMQNFELLKELGKSKKPILLKRGLSATIEEWLMAAEYIMSEGNEDVILCERGIRTFETYTRNTLDLSAVLAAKKLSHLPVIVDPSHAAGMWWMVEALSKAAVAVGADGIIVEVHNDPKNALCDGEQSIKPERFDALVKDLNTIAPIVNKAV